jgi:hypothetical protein
MMLANLLRSTYASPDPRSVECAKDAIHEGVGISNGSAKSS